MDVYSKMGGKSWGREVTAQREVGYLPFSLSNFSWSSHSKKSHEVQLCRVGNQTFPFNKHSLVDDENDMNVDDNFMVG